MNTIKTVMCGCAESGWETIKSILEQGFKIDYFVSITEEKATQLNVSGYKSFEDLAEKYNIPIHYANKYSLKDQADLDFFKEHEFDLLLQGGWQRLFPDEILNTLKIGAIGLHGSSEFLPKGRGRSPINWSLINGAKRFILHYFLIKPGIDNGDVIYYEMFDINEWDNCETLYLKLTIITKRFYLEKLPNVLKDLNRNLFPQIGQPTYYPKRSKEDGRIDWENKSIYDIHNFIRAITRPYPGAFSLIGNSEMIMIMIWEAQPFDTRIDYWGVKNGTVVEVFRNNQFVVKCNGGSILVKNHESSTKIVKGLLLY